MQSCYVYLSKMGVVMSPHDVGVAMSPHQKCGLLCLPVKSGGYHFCP